MIDKKKSLTSKIGYIDQSPTPSTPQTPRSFDLRRYNHQQLHPIPISRLPGLNPDSDYIAKYQLKDFRKYGMQTSDDTDYLKLCRNGGRRDLLTHDGCTPETQRQKVVEKENKKERPNQLQISMKSPSAATRPMKEKNSEIPLVDQISIDQRNTRKYRRDILPVDEKAKLYFAYNRNSGTITRVIATTPKSFRFGRSHLK
ncbi:uncharacterized protein LOC130654321 [Hydractinia symbiolongicarpus]|uniref:uncharacterized protein LOC130654321 n=1 Tax=Hydractinia symbiolongicarpus TaxID=13093 RepID=UPI00254F5FB3|nr:uncharacterized protein LOC130654321 [Hydractinia symbiolongicarpus]